MKQINKYSFITLIKKKLNKFLCAHKFLLFYLLDFINLLTYLTTHNKKMSTQ